MGYELSASQLSEMNKNGHVQFADFITEEQVQLLQHSDGEIDSFQKCPLSKKFLTHRALGKLLFELLEQRPIRLVRTLKVKAGDTLPLDHISIEEVYVGMFLSYSDHSVLFFNKSFAAEFESDGFVAIYGNARARYMQREEDAHSRHLLNKGYASGDKLRSEEYPFIFK